MNRILNVSLLSGLLLFESSGCADHIFCLLLEYGGFYGACTPAELAGESGPTLTVVVNRLDPKTAPVGLEADEDTKDVAAKDRRKFKPSAGSETGLDRRYQMRAKRDDAAACLRAEIPFVEPVNASLRVAIDDTTGLVDGASLGFLERRIEAPGDGEAEVVRVEVVWNETINGFSVRARVDGELAGDVVEHADTSEIFVQIARTGVYCYPAVGDGHDDFGELGVVLFPIDDPSGPSRFGLGVEGLGKKGSFWFAQLAFEVYSTYLGLPEAELAYLCGQMIVPLNLADFLLGFPTDPVTLDGTLSNLDVTASELYYQDSVNAMGDVYADTTDVAKVHKAVARANKRIFSLVKKSAAIAAKNGKIKALEKPVASAIDSLEVLIAVLHGFGSLSAKKLDESVEVIL